MMSFKIVRTKPDCDASGKADDAVGDSRDSESGRDDLDFAPGSWGGGFLSSFNCARSPRRVEPVLPESFGRYQVIRVLGQGSMGTVYLANDVQLDRQVALKVPHLSALEQKPEIRVRFLREARAAARFQHANFCPIHDIGEVNGVPYLTMAFIQGQALSASIQSGEGWPIRKAAEIVRTLAVALAELHREGVVHRDLKPANVMINARGVPVVMDFGLARSFAGADPGCTTAGAIIGTPSYMSPEQALGNREAVDHRSDLYSLGVILYELLTGCLPFSGPMVKVLGMIAHVDPPPPSTHRADLDLALEKICLKALAKRPDDRFVSMDVFAQALQDWLDSKQIVVDSEDVCLDSDDDICLELEAVPIEPKPVTPEPIPVKPEPIPVKPVALEPEPPRRDFVPTRLDLVPERLEFVPTRLDLTPERPEFVPTRLDLTPGRLDPAPAKPAPKRSGPAPSKLTNSLGINLRLIPAGEFDMGSEDTYWDAQDDEKPRHRVQITQPFYLATTQVTVGQFRRFVKENDYRTEAERDGKGGFGWDEARSTFKQDPKFSWRTPGFPQGDEQPVVNVTWNDAVDFCTWLEYVENRPYRLPTEAEWEYACRAGTTSLYWFGNNPETLALTANIADGTARKKFPHWPTISAEDGYVFTAPVGKFRPNPWDLYDMHGNVWEWCWDWYDPAFYSSQVPPVKDPCGPFLPSSSSRVIRGGAWNDDPRNARSAARSSNTPSYRDFLLGFRLALEIM